MSLAPEQTPLMEPLAVLSRFRKHDYSLTDFLAARIELLPDAPAVQFEGRCWTYAELGERIGQWAGWLSNRNVGYGDRVAVMAANHAETVALLFAVARLGAVLVPLNPDYGVPETEYVLDHAGVCGLIVTPETADIADTAVAHGGLSVWRACMGPDLAREITQESMPSGAPRGQADDVFLIIYTSGTTGFPKGAMHGQRGYVLTAEAFIERLWLQPDERVMCVMPMFHVNALMYSVGGALASGATLLVVKRFSASTFWQTVRDLRATEVNLVAAAGAILARRPRSEYVPGHGLKKMFVAPQTQVMVDALRNEFHVPVLVECYGMTEIPGVISNPFHGPHITGTMGVLCKHPDSEIARPQARIVNDDGQDVAPGETGELLIKTPTMMLGYYNDPEQTRGALMQGWFKTGDLVKQDPNGYYRFVARKKDIIRRRGENIASAELERIIGEMPGVSDVAVIGVPSELGEEDILAAVVAEPGVDVSAQAVGDWARTHLAAVKVPRYVVFIDAVPLTPTHKPAKHRLKDDPDLLRRAHDLAVQVDKA